MECSTIYFIFSLPKPLILAKESINVMCVSSYFSFKIIKEELMDIRPHNAVEKLKCEINFDKLYIYIYKLDFNFRENEAKFKIRIKYMDNDLSSIYEYKIKKYSKMFYFMEKFERKNNISKDEVKEFIEGKFVLNEIQKFLIYKNYLYENSEEYLIDYLIESVFIYFEINENISFRFLLIYFSFLIENKNNLMLKKMISNIRKKKSINIKESKKDSYDSIVENIKGFKNNFIGDNELQFSFDLFFLIYDQFNGNKNFIELFNVFSNKKEVIKYIFEHSEIFYNFNCSQLEHIFPHIDMEDFNNLISCASNFEEYIKFFCSKKKDIENHHPKINIDNYSKDFDENLKLNLLIEFINLILDIQYLTFPTNKFMIYIDNLNMKNYRKLYQLNKEFFENQKYIIKLKNISKKIKESVHETGIHLIQEKKLNNLEIITFIQEDSIENSDQYKKEKKYACLIQNLNLDDVNDEFIQKFNDKKFDYQKIFETNYKDFIDSLFKCIYSFKHLNILYNFSCIQNYSKKNEIIFNCNETIKKNLKKDDLSNSELGKIFGKLFELISENNNNNDYLNQLMKNIKKFFSEKEINEIYISILNNLKNKLNDKIINKLIENISENSENKSINEIISYLTMLTDQDLQILFLEKQDKRIIDENEIFCVELPENCQLINKLIEMGYFKDDYLNKTVNYIEKTKEIMENLRIKLDKFQFNLHRMKVMYKLNEEGERNDLRLRISIILLGKNPNILFNKLVEKINSCKKIFESIEDIINIFSVYYSEENKLIENYKTIKEKMLNDNICDFPQNILKDKNFHEASKKVIQIKKLKKSKFFIEIFNYNKKYNNALNETINKFKNLKNLFDLNTENQIDLNLLEVILNKMEDDEINKEIDILIEIFEIKKKEKKINKKLESLKNKKAQIKKLNKIILLLKDFEFENSQIVNTLTELIENLENNPSLEKLIEINEELSDLNLKILDPNLNSNFFGIIDKMYEKPELIKFIINKNINDIHQIGEFIDDSEDVFLNISDINQLETCMIFIQELQWNKTTEEQFFDNFLSIIKNDNYKDIGIKFENSSGKYNDFYELYTNHLNPNGLNKEHIKTIYESSTFNLNFFEEYYKCNVVYKNSGKNIIRNFDDILDLRDIALLRKKDQREGDYIEICEKFANIINEIQEILDILNIISLKGYFEEINYEIKIENGNVKEFKINKIDNKAKSLKDIISELKMIKDKQDNEVKSIYLSNPITRMIYGRQFNLLYKLSTQNFNCDKIENLNVIRNILKYVTNNHIKKEIKIAKINEDEHIQLKKNLENVNWYLKELLKIKNMSLKEIFQTSFLKDKNKKGIYSHSCNFEDIEKNAIYCSFSLTDNFPSAQTVLYCKDSTSEEEILSFIYKCVKCEYNVLFIIIKPENLKKFIN